MSLAMPNVDPSFQALAEQIGVQLAAQLHERLRSHEPIVPPEYLTPAQTAQLTGFSPRALEAMRARRAGPAFIKIGEGKNGAIRYRIDDVRKWLNCHREETTDA